MHANYIYYIESGEIVESGTYDRLVSSKGKFYQQFIAHSQKLISQNHLSVNTAATTANLDSSSAFFGAASMSFNDSVTAQSLERTMPHGLN